MAKLVGVVHENEDDSSGNSTWNSKCLARRQLPLTIEQDLTMIMALDDACLACSSSTLLEISDQEEINVNMATFLRKYEALSRDEVTAALMVNFDDLSATMSNEVSCVGCRRSVENMLQKLYNSGDPALEPLVITDDKVISVGRDHITTPKALANLFCNQLFRLRTTYIDPITGSYLTLTFSQFFLVIIAYFRLKKPKKERQQSMQRPQHWIRVEKTDISRPLDIYMEMHGT